MSGANDVVIAADGPGGAATADRPLHLTSRRPRSTGVDTWPSAIPPA